MAITRAFAVAVPTSGGSPSGSGTTQTTGTFDSTGYTHLVIFAKHEGATTSITPSDNKSSTGWTGLTKNSNRAVDSWGQFHWVKIGSPGTGHTVTVTLGAARDFRSILVWRVNAGTGEISLVDETDAQSPSDTTAIDAGTISNAGADAIVSFMGVSEYAASVYTAGSGWTEDFDPNGPNYTYGQSRASETTTSIDPVCTGSSAQDWVAFAAAFKEASSGVSITPGLGQLTLTGAAPTPLATDHKFVSAGLGQLSFAGLSPAMSLGITTGLGELSLTGLVPALAATDHHFVSSGLGELTFTGYAPTFATTGNYSLTSGLAQLTFTGLAPSVSSSASVSITAGLGQLTFTGYEPSQTLTLPSPAPGQLILTGYAPTVQVPGQVIAGLGQLVLTGLAPTVSATGNYAISPGLAQLTLTGFAPSFVATANQFASPGVGQTTLTGFAPSLAATEHKFATPSFGDLQLTGYAPSLEQAGAFAVAPGVGILELLGLVPGVLNSGDTRVRRPGGPRRRNYIYKGARYHNLTPDELMRLIAADAIDITREDIKVVYKGKKPHKIAKDAWAELQETMKSLDSVMPREKISETPEDDDADIEAILALL